MKKNRIKSAFFVLPFALLFLLFGCQKLFDYMHRPGGGDAVSKICQVKTIHSNGPHGASYVFNYNQRGDLESVITDMLNDGNPNIFFIYDNKHRPIQVLSSFTPTATTPGNAWSWEKFGYNNTNQVIKDTTYQLVEIAAGGVIVPSDYYLSIAVFQYDAFNRVVDIKDSVWIYGVFYNTDHFSYKYDENGNLAYTARQYRSNQPWDTGNLYNDTFRVTGYDNKINIRRTSKMWMFMDRNYSVNNALTGATYNTYGLPVYFDSREYLRGLNTLITFVTGGVTVEYNCEGSQK